MRQPGTQNNINTDRLQSIRETYRHIQTYSQTDRQTKQTTRPDRQTYKQTGIQQTILPEKHAHIQTVRERDRHIQRHIQGKHTDTYIQTTITNITD